MQIFIVVVSICCHEFAHAWVALKQGDPTAANQGHLTLNPVKQMGPISIIMMLFIGIAWGQVPVNPANMKHRWSDSLVSFAGPATNVLIFIFSSIVLGLLWHFGGNNNAQILFGMAGTLNITLFFINIIPVPGFDGWHIICYFFPKLYNMKSETLVAFGFALVFLILIFIDKIYDLGEHFTLELASVVMSLFGGGA